VTPMQVEAPRIPDERDIGRIAALIDIADKSDEARGVLLTELTFAPFGLGATPLAPKSLEPFILWLKARMPLERLLWLLQRKRLLMAAPASYRSIFHGNSSSMRLIG
jgi:hypothetical protein